MQFYKITEFSNKIGVSVSTLRLWEKEGLLIPHHRTKGNQRVYTETQVKEYFNETTEKETC